MTADEYHELPIKNAESLEQIKAMLEQLIEASKPAYITMKDIAAEMGVCYEGVSRHPWMMPNYGQSDIPGRHKKWHRKNWEDWKSGIDYNHRRWDAASRRERGQLMGLRGVA